MTKAYFLSDWNKWAEGVFGDALLTLQTSVDEIMSCLAVILF